MEDLEKLTMQAEEPQGESAPAEQSEAAEQEQPAQERQEAATPSPDALQEALKQIAAQQTPPPDVALVQQALQQVAQQYPEAAQAIDRAIQEAQMQRQLAEMQRKAAILDAHTRYGIPLNYLENNSATPLQLQAAILAYQQMERNSPQQPSQSQNPPPTGGKVQQNIPPSQKVAPAVGSAPRNTWSRVGLDDLQQMIEAAQRGKLRKEDLPE